MLHTLTINNTERGEILELLARARPLCNQSDEAFIREGVVLARFLPYRLQSEIRQFVLDDHLSALLVRGNPTETFASIATPPTHPLAPPRLLNDAELLCGFYMALLGEPFGFASQQSGNLFNHIIAVKESEAVSNSSAGSRFHFDFHTEDAFHSYPPDYLGLFCVRNHECAITSLAEIPLDLINDRDRQLLMTCPIAMQPNAMHVDGGATAQYHHSVLDGNIDQPYIRLNLNTLSLPDISDINLREALRRLVEIIRNSYTSVVLESGDMLIINNRLSLHRRDRYEPRYDAMSRWLIRAVVQSDIRRTRSLRATAASRIIEREIRTK